MGAYYGVKEIKTLREVREMFPGGRVDEPLVAVEGARDEVAEIDHATEAEIEELRAEQRAGCGTLGVDGTRANR